MQRGLHDISACHTHLGAVWHTAIHSCVCAGSVRSLAPVITLSQQHYLQIWHEHSLHRSRQVSAEPSKWQQLNDHVLHPQDLRQWGALC